MTLKTYFINICTKIDKWYWKLQPLPRHIVGWFAVIFCIFLIYFGGWICYRSGLAIGQLCQSTWFVITEGEEQEEEFTSGAEYSWNGKHREFKLDDSQKQTKKYIHLSKDFNDLNDTQLAAAQKLGIKPLAQRSDIENVRSKLVELHDTRYYIIDNLTHSSPFLVPDAADFLTALGRLMQEYSGTHSRFIITSVLRTTGDVKRLSRSNVNASKNSCHCYGTTFDITYNRFDRHGIVYDGQLKADLARALYDLQQAGYCYVKYEHKQACFHVTVRPRK